VPEQEDRLIRCFSSVFTGLTPEEIRNTTAESMGTWDSLSTVMLVAVIEEEFNIQIDPEVISEMNSFAAFRTYLSRLSAAVD
jgi:acyl carrier protein